MANIVNLNRARKKMALATKEKAADANRVKFGRLKTEKQKQKLEREQRDRNLDGRRLDDDE